MFKENLLAGKNVLVTGGGSGLGLYLVHGLVKAHGGSTTVDDAPGGGARITVALPVEPRS